MRVLCADGKIFNPSSSFVSASDPLKDCIEDSEIEETVIAPFEFRTLFTLDGLLGSNEEKRAWLWKITDSEREFEQMAFVWNAALFFDMEEIYVFLGSVFSDVMFDAV